MDKQKTYIIIGVVVVLVIVGIILLVSKKDSTSTNLTSRDMSKYATAVRTSTLKSPSQLLKAVPLEGYNNLALVDNNGNLNSIQFPQGIIVIWSGSQTNIPDGWTLCDGKTINGVQVPDLRGKFVLGWNPNDNKDVGRDVNTFKQTGGAERHTLTVPEIPSHTHDYNQSVWGDGNIDDTPMGDNYGRNLLTRATTGTGGGLPHNNMPPYYVLAYIMKL